MSRIIMSVVFTGLAAITAGCSVAPKVQYDGTKSRAMNIAEAGGIYKGLKDAAVPKDTSGALTDSVIYSSMYAGMGLASPAPGLSNLQGFGIGILSGLLEPDSPAARNSFIAWMPAEMAKSPDEARTAIQAIFRTAVGSMLDEQSIKYSFYYGRDSGVKVVNMDHIASFVLDKAYCQIEGRSCSITMSAYIPVKRPAPDFVDGVREAYFFSATGDRRFNTIAIDVPKTHPLPQAAIYQKVSQHMPSWFFIYASPRKTIGTTNGESLKYPVVFESGKANLFVNRN